MQQQAENEENASGKRQGKGRGGGQKGGKVTDQKSKAEKGERRTVLANGKRGDKN